MKFPLKYLVPSLVLLIGVIAMSINMYFFIDSEKKQLISTAKERALIIGHRLANEIEKRNLYDKDHYPDLIRMVSQYSLEHVNSIEIYNQKKEIIFKSVPVKFDTVYKHDITNILSIVIKEVKANVDFDKNNVHIDAIIPLLMPEEQREIYSKEYGALHLEYDMSDIKKSSTDTIIKHSILNGVVILLMVLTLAILIYFLILKQLSQLHISTTKMAEGDMSIRLSENSKNELGDLNRSFNKMANQISRHQDSMEHEIQLAVSKNTEQNRMLLQQARLAAMGEMINNIAHQWRQPLNTLGIVLQKLVFFQNSDKLDEKKLTDSVDKGMFLINQMTTTIDDFSNFFMQSKEKKVFFIKKSVEEVLSLMEGSIEENNVKIDLEIEKLTQILGYKNELMQVVLNIVNNAKDALVENRETNRNITIRCTADEEEMHLEIKDNAGGIPEEVIDKIFDPYFSTKEEGKGTGIGLYMSKTIIEDNMKGKLKVHNDEEGAVFSIVLFIKNEHPFCDIE